MNSPAQRLDQSIVVLGLAQAVLSTTLALIVLAGGAADAAAACAVAAPDDAEEEPVEGEDAGLAAGAVWSVALPEAGVAGPLLAALAVDDWPADPGC
jgi:hypothetical protein